MEAHLHAKTPSFWVVLGKLNAPNCEIHTSMGIGLTWPDGIVAFYSQKRARPKLCSDYQFGNTGPTCPNLNSEKSEKFGKTHPCKNQTPILQESCKNSTPILQDQIDAYLARSTLILQDSCIFDGYLARILQDLARWCVILQDYCKILVRSCKIAVGIRLGTLVILGLGPHIGPQPLLYDCRRNTLNLTYIHVTYSQHLIQKALKMKIFSVCAPPPPG